MTVETDGDGNAFDELPGINTYGGGAERIDERNRDWTESEKAYAPLAGNYPGATMLGGMKGYMAIPPGRAIKSMTSMVPKFAKEGSKNLLGKG